MSKRKRLWLDLGKPGSLATNLRCQQDHAVGLLRTILHREGIVTGLASTRNILTKDRLCARFKETDILLMSVLSFNFPMAVWCAKLFKRINPKGVVIVGGMHASVALNEMTAIEEFDYICKGSAEKIIAALASEPEQFERVIEPQGAKSMAEWPYIDRTLWPKPIFKIPGIPTSWPLERFSIESPPSVTILTSRVCPWQCAFCNESSYIPALTRRPVEMVIEELNMVDSRFGPFNSVIIHDSNFFQNPAWLREWLEK
jgi:anaerobic magnesium-protoporphyrin IX monomethyl ester cyclase